jgi:hypothetical protein
MLLGLIWALVFLAISASVRAEMSPPAETVPIARPNPYDRGTCFQWKGCKGESIGAMPVDRPEFCGPLGGKSWKNFDGKCVDLPEGPRASEPPSPSIKPFSGR